MTGIVLAAGIAATIWWVVSHRSAQANDPQTEIDRRIHDLEGSLNRLQDVFGHAAGG